MNMPDQMLQEAQPPRRLQLWGAQVRLWPVLAGLLIVLFPFDWLSEVWPAFGRPFDLVFVNARDHAIGHATMFLLMSLLALLSIPALRPRPALYFGLMLLVGVGQETLQAFFKQAFPNIYAGRDLFFDLTGVTAAYLIVFTWRWLRKKLVG
ncbi:MAG TPA: hypothetical protein VH599_01355 [Ktedonobacterales bacterium]|jgi:hypothetical protein